jgi:hypothetical protein
MRMVVCEKHTTGECKLDNCNHGIPHTIFYMNSTSCLNANYFTPNYITMGLQYCPFDKSGHVCSDKSKFEIIMREAIKGNKNGH